MGHPVCFPFCKDHSSLLSDQCLKPLFPVYYLNILIVLGRMANLICHSTLAKSQKSVSYTIKQFLLFFPAFTCHDSGATVLAYAPKHQLLISGGRKGYTCAFDLWQRQQRQLFQSHDSPVKAIAIDPTEEYFVTGSAEGNIKVNTVMPQYLLHYEKKSLETLDL